MNLRPGLPLLSTLVVAGALVSASGPMPGSDAAQPKIEDISLRVSSKSTSLVIEVSEPVPYVATRPDPVTVILEFRNTTAKAAVHSVAKSVRDSIAAVYVEPAEALGAPISRVRIALAQPLKHHVRSDRNKVIVELDKPDKLDKLASQVQAPPPVRQRPAIDPIAALGLDSGSGPSASAPAAAGAPTPPAAAPPTPAAMSAPAPQPQARDAAMRPTTSLAAVPGQRLFQTAQPQTTLPQPTMTPLGTGQPTERQYSGHPISLDFQGADLRAVLRTFAEISGLNIVIDPRVNGTVDVALRDVPWDQALDMILRANSLGYVVNGTIVRVAPLDALEAEQRKLRDLQRAQAEAGQVTTLTRQLSYAKGEEIVKLLTDARVLSPRGTAYVDGRTNTVILTDLADRLQNATQLITTLDTAQPQVEIEARIVQTNKDYARALGVQWGFNGRVDPALGNTTPLAFPNTGNLGGRAQEANNGLGTQGQTGGTASTQVPTAVNLPVAGATSAVGLALGSVNGAFNLDVALSALERSGNGRLLSTPRVTTQNNIPAEVTQGVQIPYQTISNNTVTIQFKDAALTLRVTPQITAVNTVIMQISVENASPDFARALHDIPPINTQRANTQVLVGDGQTTVIGGIYVSNEQSNTDRTPGMSRLPLLGWLFKRDAITDASTELLIFITPRIIKG
jgi:type IV pilus secretin PilQ/predicted competence protein